MDLLLVWCVQWDEILGRAGNSRSESLESTSFPRTMKISWETSLGKLRRINSSFAFRGCCQSFSFTIRSTLKLKFAIFARRVFVQGIRNIESGFWWIFGNEKAIDTTLESLKNCSLLGVKLALKNSLWRYEGSSYRERNIRTLLHCSQQLHR